MFRILIADDEKKIRETLTDYLSAKDFEVSAAKDGREALELAENREFDLAVLDVLMPVMNGLDACRQIRKFSDMPIIFLSALGEEENLLSGYKNGADDYIVKPFPLSVLTEKINTLIKRHNRINDAKELTLSGITLKLTSRQVFCGEKEIRLSNKDYDLLKVLMLNKNAVLSREEILNKVWGYGYDGEERAVDTHIKRLRKALGEKAELVVTVNRVGYSFKST